MSFRLIYDDDLCHSSLFHALCPSFLVFCNETSTFAVKLTVQGTGQCPAEKPRLARSLRKMGRTLTCPLSRENVKYVYI